MIAFLDASVLLRLTLRQAGSLAEWPAIEKGVVDPLVEVECLRSLDRFRVLEAVADSTLAEWRGAVYRLLAAAEVVDLTRSLLLRAAQPLPTALGTLDAIHLAAALSWCEASGENLVVATHDRAFARAARAHGFDVVGA